MKKEIKTLIINLYELIDTEVDNKVAKEYGLDLIKKLVEELENEKED